MGVDGRTRVLLVDDHPVVLWGIKSLLMHRPDMEIVGEAGSAAESLRAAGRLGPDVVLLPARLGGEFIGIDLCRRLRAVCDARLVLYTAFSEDVPTAGLVRSGEVTVIPKTTDGPALVEALRTVSGAAGGPGAAGGAGSARPAAASSLGTEARLTEREREVLGLLLEHRTNPEIAADLFLEVSTVKTHVRNVLRKLGLPTRRALFTDVRGPADRGAGALSPPSGGMLTGRARP